MSAIDIELPDPHLYQFARSIVLGESDIAINTVYPTFLWGFDASDPRNWLVLVWSNLTTSEKQLALYRLGYKQNATIFTILNSPPPQHRVKLPIFRNGKPRQIGI